MKDTKAFKFKLAADGDWDGCLIFNLGRSKQEEIEDINNFFNM